MNSSQSPPLVVAAFDFDGTLTRRDTLVPYLIRALGWPQFLRALLRAFPELTGYALGFVTNDVAKQQLLRLTLKNRSITEVEGWTKRWVAKELTSRLRAWTLAHLARHQKERHHCVMVSASPDIYLKRVAQKLGFDALICTEMEVLDEKFTGEMRSPNCYGEQKAIRLRQHLAQKFGAARAEHAEIHAYGDSGGDLALLKMADHAWYRSKPWVQKPGT
jgi:phosphatidylglycerophosphatase C